VHLILCIHNVEIRWPHFHWWCFEHYPGSVGRIQPPILAASREPRGPNTHIGRGQCYLVFVLPKTDVNQGAKSNRTEAQQLAKDVCQTVQEILQVFPIVPSPPMTSPFDISKNGLEQFRRCAPSCESISLDSNLIRQYIGGRGHRRRKNRSSKHITSLSKPAK
jgi:hypothetical protein